jgi:cell division protein FtsQ
VKRPQGFDRAAPQPPAPERQRPKVPTASARPTTARPTTADRSRSVEKDARAAARAARRERLRVERDEVKRFTRRSRIRRRIVGAAIAAVAGLVATVGIVVFSPILDLRQIEVVGTDRLSASDVADALNGQLGTPLALLDVASVEQELARFPVIRSYSIEAVPPHTVRITVVEREPIGLIADGSTFVVVDPAGVVVDSVAERSAGLPIIDAGDATLGNHAFESAVAVLLALPADMRDRVDRIKASTKDDVEFSLVGGTQSVRWGSADRSDYKARVFAALVKAKKPSATVEYDVSSPDAPVVRVP